MSKPLTSGDVQPVVPGREFILTQNYIEQKCLWKMFYGDDGEKIFSQLLFGGGKVYETYLYSPLSERKTLKIHKVKNNKWRFKEEAYTPFCPWKTTGNGIQLIKYILWALQRQSSRYEEMAKHIYGVTSPKNIFNTTSMIRKQIKGFNQEEVPVICQLQGVDLCNGYLSLRFYPDKWVNINKVYPKQRINKEGFYNCFGLLNSVSFDFNYFHPPTKAKQTIHINSGSKYTLDLLSKKLKCYEIGKVVQKKDACYTSEKWYYLPKTKQLSKWSLLRHFLSSINLHDSYEISSLKKYLKLSSNIHSQPLQDLIASEKGWVIHSTASTSFFSFGEYVAVYPADKLENTPIKALNLGALNLIGKQPSLLVANKLDYLALKWRGYNVFTLLAEDTSINLKLLQYLKEKEIPLLGILYGNTSKKAVLAGIKLNHWMGKFIKKKHPDLYIPTTIISLPETSPIKGYKRLPVCAFFNHYKKRQRSKNYQSFMRNTLGKYKDKQSTSSK